MKVISSTSTRTKIEEEKAGPLGIVHVKVEESIKLHYEIIENIAFFRTYIRRLNK